MDRFSDDTNKKLPAFNSKHYCPGTSGVNAFCSDWSGVNNWLCPPVSLIGSVIQFMKVSKAKGTLIVPLWKSAYFWPLIYPNGLHLSKIIKQFVVVEPYYTSVCNNIFSGYPNFKTLALSIDCSK